MAFVAFSFFLVVAGNNSNAEPTNLTSQLPSVSTSAIQPPPTPTPIFNGAQSISNDDKVSFINDRQDESSSSAIADENYVVPLTNTLNLQDTTENKENAEPIKRYKSSPLATNYPEAKLSEVAATTTEETSETTTAAAPGAERVNIPNETSKASPKSNLYEAPSMAHLNSICSSHNYLGCLEAVSEASTRTKLALLALVLAMSIFRHLKPRFQPHMVLFSGLFCLFFTAKRFNEASVYWGIGILVALAISAHSLAGSPTLKEMLRMVPIIEHFIKKRPLPSEDGIC